MDFIDLRNDSVTWPTDAMREAMKNAVVGDDVYQDDPTVRELESYAASLVGKEAALFVPSRTFGNELALFTHCKQGHEVVLDDASHIVQHERGAPSIIAGVQLRTVTDFDGSIMPKLFEDKIRKTQDIHEPHTGLLCIENPTPKGRVISVEGMEEFQYIANRHHVPIHLDGARLFNAAAFLNVPAVDLTKHVDTVVFSLDKGLCAPFGAILAGTRDFIEEARNRRKLMGGGLHQSGFLAAAALVALRDMRNRLDEDRETAQYLADELAQFEQIEIDPTSIDINMVFFKFAGNAIDGEAFTEFFKQQNILVSEPTTDGTIRLVTHYWIKKTDIDKFIKTMSHFLR